MGAQDTCVLRTHGCSVHTGTQDIWMSKAHGCSGHMDAQDTWMLRTHGYSGHVSAQVAWVLRTHRRSGHTGAQGTWVLRTHEWHTPMEAHVIELYSSHPPFIPCNLLWAAGWVATCVTSEQRLGAMQAHTIICFSPLPWEQLVPGKR